MGRAGEDFTQPPDSPIINTIIDGDQDGAEKCIQLWTKIDVVTLHKLIKTMHWQMCAVIKAKGGTMKY